MTDQLDKQLLSCTIVKECIEIFASHMENLSEKDQHEIALAGCITLLASLLTSQYDQITRELILKQIPGILTEKINDILNIKKRQSWN